jgi:c-di-GMP-binding flagellar brake protein YcgR
VLLLRPGKVSRGTTSLDLSSTGCRVTIPDQQKLSPGQMLQVAVDLDAGRSVWADGQVVWVDDEAQVAALRFTRMDPADQERLDRRVLAALSPRFGSFHARPMPSRHTA